MRRNIEQLRRNDENDGHNTRDYVVEKDWVGTENWRPRCLVFAFVCVCVCCATTRVKVMDRCWQGLRIVFPQQRKLIGSSAQISSGVLRCSFLVRFQNLPSKILEGSGLRRWFRSKFWGRFRARSWWVVPEHVPGKVPEGPVVVTGSFAVLEWTCCRLQRSSSGRFSAGAQKRVLVAPKRIWRLISAVGDTTEAYFSGV